MKKQLFLSFLLSIIVSLPAIAVEEQAYWSKLRGLFSSENPVPQPESFFDKAKKFILGPREIEKPECDGFCKSMQNSSRNFVQATTNSVKPIMDHVAQYPKSYVFAGAAAASGLGYMAYKKYAGKKAEEADDQIGERTFTLPSVKQALIGLGAAATAGVMYKVGLFEKMGGLNYGSYAQTFGNTLSSAAGNLKNYTLDHKLAASAIGTAGTVVSGLGVYSAYSPTPKKQVVHEDEVENQQDGISQIISECPKREITMFCANALEMCQELDIATVYQLALDEWKAKPGFKRGVETVKNALALHLKNASDETYRKAKINIATLARYLELQ